jgi:hypothetical protein
VLLDNCKMFRFAGQCVELLLIALMLLRGNVAPDSCRNKAIALIDLLGGQTDGASL